jgi:hypothetical protein
MFKPMIFAFRKKNIRYRDANDDENNGIVNYANRWERTTFTQTLAKRVIASSDRAR